MAAYCAEADVIALLQNPSAYSGSTVPTTTQLGLFMDNRTGEIHSWMVAVVGVSAPGPSTYSVSIDTSTDVGTSLSNLCRMTCALGSAADALEAGGATDTPARTERVAELLADFFAAKEQIVALALVYTGISSTFAANHFTEGRVTAATITSAIEDGFEFDGRTEW